MKKRNLISYEWAMKRLLKNKTYFGDVEGIVSEAISSMVNKLRDTRWRIAFLFVSYYKNDEKFSKTLNIKYLKHQ